MRTSIECKALPIRVSSDDTGTALSTSGLLSIRIFGYGLLSLVLLAISACDSGGSSISALTLPNQASTQVVATLAASQVAQSDGSVKASANIGYTLRPPSASSRLGS